jgi:class 3 adenylate cyclase
MVAAELDLRLDSLRAQEGLAGALIDAFKTFLREAPDEALFRMSPLRWASSHGATEQQGIDLFLHAAHAGILDFAWGILCPGCLAFLSTPGALRAIAKKRCNFCHIDIAQSLDDRVEVAFTVAPAVRQIRFHNPDSLDLRQDALRLYFSSSLSPESVPHRTLGEGILQADSIPAGGARTLSLALPRGETVLLAPANHSAVYFIGRRSLTGPATASVELFDGWSIPAIVELPVGPVAIELHNRTPRPLGYILTPTRSSLWPPAAPPGEPLNHPVRSYLTGPRLAVSQTFRELFRAESLPAEGGLEFKGTTLLFTDLKGSTALYERLGDLRAYELVRQHFAVLRSIAAAAGGSIVKTIGDAVMASFVDPLAAMHAVTRMHQAIEQLGGGELHLKIGVHSGSCIAVELNERLDYFGRTVNIAARVQGIAGPGEIVCTQAVYEKTGVPEVVAAAGFSVEASAVQLRGIAGATAVVRLRRRPPDSAAAAPAQ